MSNDNPDKVGSDGKLSIVRLPERGGKVRAGRTQGTDRLTLQTIVLCNLEKGSIVYADEHSGYSNLSDYGSEHDSVTRAPRSLLQWRGNPMVEIID